MSSTQNWEVLVQKISDWALLLGFDAVGITDTQPDDHAHYLEKWLAAGLHGEMHYMSAHGAKRQYPNELLPGTLRIISVRMDYLSTSHPDLPEPEDANAYIARYAMGRDYHKVLRRKLAQLAEKISTEVNDHHYRVFTDSAPVLEKAFAQKAGLGWIGKNTLLINKNAGSWFFIGEILTNLPLPISNTLSANHCGSCSACLDICPTQAFIAPYQLDARKCIAYLTIEYKGSIPLHLRKPIGNRIFGCDDCQTICPWNKFAQLASTLDFYPRNQLNEKTLIELFSWSEAEYLTYTEGSALRRIGYEGWLRNIAIGLGNAKTSETIIHALNQKINHASSLVREHVLWALSQHTTQSKSTYF